MRESTPTCTRLLLFALGTFMLVAAERAQATHWRGDVDVEIHFIKYEWRDSLCRKRVVDCEPRERNRFWDEDDGRLGFAPYPAGLSYANSFTILLLPAC